MDNVCKECGTLLPCVDDICKECDEQFIFCYNKCKTPCRSKDEQKKKFDKWKLDWDKQEVK